MRFVWVVAVSVLAGAGVARAQEPALSWQAPEGCPAREAWLGALRARVDDAAWSEAASKLRATVRIEPTAQGFALQLDTELDGASGQRGIEAASCAELVEASALIVAFAIDPRAAERAASAGPVVGSSGESASPATVTAAPVEPEPAPPPEPAQPDEPEPVERRAEPRPPEPELERPPAPEPAPKSRAPASTRLFVRPLALFDVGTLPDLAFGPAFQAGVDIHRLSIELGVSYLLPQSIAHPEDDRAVAELRWLAGSAGACYAVGDALELAPCLRLELGRTWGEGKNLGAGAFSGGATWLAGLAAVRVGYELLAGFAVHAEFSAGIPVTRAVFSVGGVGDVYDSPVVAGRLAAGATLQF